MIITPAYAQGGGGSEGGFATLVPLVLIFVVFYFLLIRPQQKRAKNHRNMLAAIVRGDKIITGGGIIGTVTKVISEEELTVEIAEGIRIKVQRGLIASVQPKSQPSTANETNSTSSSNEGLLGKLFGSGKK